MVKISVVIVTYNRLEKLKHTLECYSNQKYLPSDIVVVNNHSTDGTESFLNIWANDNAHGVNKHIITTDRNLGGAGGFSIGLAKTLELNVDWIWIADDDAYPYPDTLELINKRIESTNKNDVACICSSVICCGQIDLDHRRKTIKKFIWRPYRVPLEQYSEDMIEIDESSFVGSCFKISAIKKAGLPNKDFFIYFDDTEYSHRIRKYGKIILVPEIKVLHDTASYVPKPDVLISWREYYLLRNHIYTLKYYHKITFVVYTTFKLIKSAIDFAKNSNTSVLKLNLLAIVDGVRERLGIHNLYKPGFEIKNKK